GCSSTCPSASTNRRPVAVTLVMGRRLRRPAAASRQISCLPSALMTAAFHEPDVTRTGRRHPGDIVRLIAAVLLVVVCAGFARHGHVSASEADAFRLFNDLPRIFTPLALALLVIGSPVAVGVTALAALVARRARLAGELVAAAALGYGLARLLQEIVGRAAPTGHVAQFHHVAQLVVSDRVTLGHGFPSAAVAVAAALATAAGPYMRRPAGRA